MIALKSLSETPWKNSPPGIKRRFGPISQNPKQGDSSIEIAKFFSAIASISAVITCLLPRAAHDGLFGFARKWVQMSIFFVMSASSA